MSWMDLLSNDNQEQTLPWLGGRLVHGLDRTWKLAGKPPKQHGWYRFSVSGSNKTRLLGPGEPDFCFDEGRALVRGYLIGDRIIPDGAHVEVDPERLIDQTEKVFLVEPGLERFARGLAARGRDGKLVYVREEFPLGPEAEVREAWQEQVMTVDHVSGVTPALDLAFLWMTWRRMLAEERRRELARQKTWAEERNRFGEKMATAAAVRYSAAHDFQAAATAALEVSGAELLDHRAGRRKNETVVTFRFYEQSFTCLVRTNDLTVIDSGICLEDHVTGEKGDTYFTLESLPAVIAEAIETHRLVVWGHDY